MRNLKILLLAVIGISFLASCTPYEDGPAISFTSGEKKLVNEWVQSAAYKNDATETIDTSYTTTYNDDNTFDIESTLINVSGAWSLNDDGDMLTTTYTFFGQSVSENATILRLKKDELWLKTIDGEDIYITHFVPKI